MNLLSLQNQVIALWVIVLLLIVYILFLQQKRSYFVPPVSSVITLMDLQEYSYMGDVQRKAYTDQLAAASQVLKMNNTNMKAYKSNLDAIMQTAFMTPTSNNLAPTSNNLAPTSNNFMRPIPATR